MTADHAFNRDGWFRYAEAIDEGFRGDAVRAFGQAARTFAVRDRRMNGRFRVELLARDLSGNRLRVKRARLTIR